MSGDVYIVGIDMIKFGKFPERSVESLGAEAALGALDDAGLTIRDMEALYCGNLMFAAGMVGQRILREIDRVNAPDLQRRLDVPMMHSTCQNQIRGNNAIGGRGCR